ncbi:MAG: alanine--tRNA ligase [Culicoidibacterales bacterium]
MQKRTGAEIRDLFLQFWASKGHSIEASSSLVPQDDPTLLWINSGVAAIKKYFDGSVIPENPRITNAQKSIRTNDIENVGVTARHHTFFEMLGNFSVGDYFREDAIKWGWEFLTSPEWIGFDPQKLYVTVYPSDKDSYHIWKDVIGLADDHIIKTEDNFWEIGEGPCGPCTEIFYDRGEAYEFDTPKEELFVSGENERWLELYNIVFSQYNAEADVAREMYKELPSQNIDTGMGLERMASILQDTPTNFETDLIFPLIKATEQFTTMKYGQSSACDTAFKVIADHIRTLTFAIADGALPSNEGRGYVLRRLLRRATRFGLQRLQIQNAFMYKIVEQVPLMMGSYYEYLNEHMSFIQKVIKTEEEKFLETLHDGLALLEKETKILKTKSLPGEVAFKLYDTYGFPFELTLEYCEENGYSVDRSEFDAELEKQRVRARNARVDASSMHAQDEVLMHFKESSTYTGYDNQFNITSEIIYYDADKQLIILKETPFYAESGGQVADSGTIKNKDFEAVVTNVKKAPNGQHMHTIKLLSGTPAVGQIADASVDVHTQQNSRKNHTATHLLHKALKEVLGTHVNQAGSLVNGDRLRFDFSHFGSISAEELKTIENRVNELIFASLPVSIEEMPIDEAKAKGAMALFGEKYGNIVRVVSVGMESIELCGGLHVQNSSEINAFTIMSESGIGSGVRRIEAYTGLTAYSHTKEQLNLLQQAAKSLNVKKVSDIEAKIAALLQEKKQLEQDLQSFKEKQALQLIPALQSQLETVNTSQLLYTIIDDMDASQMKLIVDTLKEQYTDALIVLATTYQSKSQLFVGAGKDMKEHLKAGDVVKHLAPLLGGKGGGKADFAVAGVSELDKFISLKAEIKALF